MGCCVVDEEFVDDCSDYGYFIVGLGFGDQVGYCVREFQFLEYLLVVGMVESKQFE